jgi:two-component system, OmpR family, sensor histidine kinase CpxA
VRIPSFLRFRSLFLKIFIWFWLAASSIIGVLNLMVWLSDSQTLPERINRGPLGEVLTIYSETAAQAYEQEGLKGLYQYIHRTTKNTGTEVYMYQADGTPITGAGGDNVPDVVRELQAEPVPQQQRVSHMFLGRATWGKFVTGPSGKRYIFVTRFRATGTRPSLFPPSRIAAMILTAGLVCYLLALYLASPLKKLKAAVQSFAEGNLDARVGPQLGSRKDELADLGREFDQMAERISLLIASQKRLLADISHELRSPLARLSVALELARKNSPPLATPALNRIEQESERLNELVGQLLALTRLESGAERVPAETVMLEELVQQVSDDANYEARPLNKSVQITGLEKCRVNGSAELLRSAVENVIRNAVRYTAPGTAVEVALQWKLDTAVLTVCDHGPGIPESELQRIFEPFYRVSEARDRASGGAGLGLSIAERTVKLHGGSIEARNVEGGLLVTIRLPLAPNSQNGQTQATFSPASLASG